MGRELILREVDGQTYQIEQFGPTKAIKVLTKLVKIVGEPLALAIGGAGLSKEAQAEIFGKAIGAISTRINEEEVVGMLKTLAESCLKGDQGAKINFELDFAGKLGHLFKLCKAVLEVQYGDFLGELVDLSGSLKKAEAKTSAKSTGESGALSSVA